MNAKPQIQFNVGESPQARVQKLTEMNRVLGNRLSAAETALESIRRARPAALQRDRAGNIVLNELGSRDGFVHRDKDGVLTPRQVLRVGEFELMQNFVVTGYGVVAVAYLYFCRIGPMVFGHYFVNGTSNAAAHTITLPFPGRNDAGYNPSFPIQVYDAGAWQNDWGLALMLVAGTAIVNTFPHGVGSAWTNGQTQEYAQFWYRADI